jgi:hypothetical protein
LFITCPKCLAATAAHPEWGITSYPVPTDPSAPIVPPVDPAALSDEDEGPLVACKSQYIPHPRPRKKPEEMAHRPVTHRVHPLDETKTVCGRRMDGEHPLQVERLRRVPPIAPSRKEVTCQRCMAKFDKEPRLMDYDDAAVKAKVK